MSSKKKEREALVRNFSVSDPQKHPKGFTVYKVTCNIYPLDSPEKVTQVVVWRRYNDFKKLHQQLLTLHKALHRRGEFPVFAKPKVFGRFDETVVEERRKSASDLLSFVATQSHLFMCDDFHKFFEGGEKVKRNEIEAMGKKDLLQPLNVAPTATDETDPSDGVEETTESSTDHDIFTDSLGGVWKYRKPGDNISLNGDDDSELTDDSALSTPLPDTDISFFDPLNDAPETPQTKDGETDQLQCSNTWLLSAMREIESPEVRRKAENNNASDTLNLPSPPMESPDPVDDDIGLDTTPTVSGGSEPRHKSDVDVFDPLKSGDSSVSNTHTIGDNVAKEGVNSQVKGKTSKTHFSSVLTDIASRERSRTAESVTMMDLGGKEDYIFLAANQISLAKDCEANGNYEVAFNYYKSGVGVLLKGVQGDSNKSRRDAVRRKTAQYLLKAEDIYNRHIASKAEDTKRWANNSKISPSAELDPGIAYMQGPVSELRNYKVLGIIDRVMLVLDRITEDTFIIKVLHKGGTQTDCHQRNIIPASCPYMVRFYRFYETDFAVYVLLQHATGGKLWSYLHSYLNHLETARERSESKNRAESNVSEGSQKNVYSGQHMIETEGEYVSSQAVVGKETPSSVGQSQIVNIETNTSAGKSSNDSATEVSNSYVALFTEYETSVGDLTEFGSAFYSKKDGGVAIAGTGRHADLLDKDTGAKGPNILTDNTPKTVAKSAANSHDVFQDILSKTSHPSVELFSIDSIDSDGERKDSAISENDNLATIDRIPSIPEELEDSAFADNGLSKQNVQYDEDVVSHGDADKIHGKGVIPEGGDAVVPETGDSIVPEACDLISSAKELLKSVDEVLADCDNTNPIETKMDNKVDEEDTKDQENTSLPDVSIYDINRSYNSDNSIQSVENKQIDVALLDCQRDGVDTVDEKQESTSSSTVTVIPKLFTRQLSQTLSLDRSFDSPRSCRNRNFSTIFSELDSMASKVSAFKLPETCIRQWIAEIIMAVGHLHSLGIICCDLRPDNILLGDRGHILLTFFSQWRCVPYSLNSVAVDLLYVAPELKQPCQPTALCDWWSVGVLLYELLACQTLISAHPAGITSHTQLVIPDHVSEEARSLLSQLLVVNPVERLGSGLMGVEEIKTHPFFVGMDWKVPK